MLKGLQMLKKILMIGAAMVATPAIAQEDWWVAESDNFRVYSAGGKESAAETARNLERLDQSLRLFTGVAQSDGPVPDVSKPTIFRFGKPEDVGALIGSRSVLGFFIPRAGDPVAFSSLVGSEKRRSRTIGTRTGYDLLAVGSVAEETLYHEYTHYFMYIHASAAYPIWYSEGFAELFGKIELADDGFALGAPPEDRKASLADTSVDLEKVFSSINRFTFSNFFDYYAQGWLITSYLSFAPDRQGQLAKYLNSLNAGVPDREAAEQAFGDLDTLERQLNDYRRERAMGIKAQYVTLAEPKYEVRKLTADQAARMEAYIELEAGVTKNEAKGIAGDLRPLLENYPESSEVIRTALEAEYDAGNLQRADELAKRLMEINPDSVDARLYLGRMAMQYAEQDKSWLEVARGHFLDANRLNSIEPNALFGYYLSYFHSDQEPPEDALIALERAFDIAPYDSNIRATLSHLLLTENRDEQALRVLGPILNRPHSGREISKMRDYVAQMGDGGREKLLEELRPKLGEDDDEND